MPHFKQHVEGVAIAQRSEVNVHRPAKLGVERLGDAAAEAFQPRYRHAPVERDVLKLIQCPILAFGVNNLNGSRQAEAGLEEVADFGRGFDVAFHTNNEYTTSASFPAKKGGTE